MTQAALSELSEILPALARAITEFEPRYADVQLEPIADKGLAHHHVDLVGTALLARIPKQSQLRLDAHANLAYQAACFDRASRSGHAPGLRAVLPPKSGLPRGALIVDRIDGRAARLPDDLPAIMVALAAIHSLPVPSVAERPPLMDQSDPLEALAAEIAVQAEYLDRAAIAPDALHIIRAELSRLDGLVSGEERPQRALISFDAHPGNFLVQPDGQAILVDLEKCRYSYPALDLAHATLYTSTTWEPGISVVLSPAEIAQFYRQWAETFGATGGAVEEQWHLPLRRAMWLWSVTWCAKWRVLSDRSASAGPDGEDWSSERSADALTEHFHGRVDDYLDPRVIRRIADEFDAW